MAKNNNQYRLLIKESWIILDQQQTVNKTECSVPLIIYPEWLKTKKAKVKIKSVFDALPREMDQCYNTDSIHGRGVCKVSYWRYYR